MNIGENSRPHSKHRKGPRSTGGGLDDNEKRVGRLANLVSRLYDHAPSIDTGGEHICQRDFVEIALLIGEQGEGQYRTSTINSKLSTKYDGPAPTKLPPEKENARSMRRASPATAFSRNHRPNGEFRSLPTEWIVEDWVEEAAALTSGLGLGPANVANLAEESRGLPGNEGQGLETALAKAMDGGREEDGGDRREGREGEGTQAGTNGLHKTPGETPENRPSEDSDRFSEVDICFANPPVTGRCNRRQWEWLATVTRSIQEQLCFLKLVDGSRAATYNSGEEEDGRWVVMHHETLQDDYGVSSPTRTVWEESDVIEAKEGGRFISPQEAEETGKQPEARELRVTQEALDTWTRLGAEGGSYRYKAHRRELVRTRKPQPMSTQLYDENRHDIPDLVEDALKVLRDADHEIMLGVIEDAEEAIAEREGAEARDQLTSLRLAKETVERQVIQSQGGVAQLQNAYEIQSISGRVGFQRGGPQGLMGEVKDKAYDIDGYRNYDIKSCHTAALKEVAAILEELGVEIDVSPWTEYAGKDAVVTDTGLPRSLVKVVEHAVKYGAVLPASMEQVKSFYVDDSEDEEDSTNWPSIAQEVHKYAEKGLIEDADQALKTLHDVFGEMRRVVIEMAEALLTDYYEANHSGGWMKNACGVSFAKHRYDEGHQQRSKVMAWMLQSLEAAFCHHLTILSSRSEAFSVVANEHDGLIIRKEVEDEQEFQEALQSAIRAARDRSGFHRADLVEKDFADQEDVKALYEDSSDEEETQEQDERDLTAREREQLRVARYNAKREIPDLNEAEMRRVRSGYEAPADEEEGPQPLPGAGGRGVACVGTT